MKPRSKRALAIVCGLAALGVASALVLNAFNSNLVFFFSPSQVKANEAPRERSFRIGGLVEQGSVVREAEGLTIRFVVTDLAQKIPVTYTGLLPDLLRKAKAWWRRASWAPTASSAQTRCSPSTTKITCRRKLWPRSKMPPKPMRKPVRQSKRRAPPAHPSQAPPCPQNPEVQPPH